RSRARGDRLLDRRAVLESRLRHRGGAGGGALRIRRARTQSHFRRDLRAQPGVGARAAEDRDATRGLAAPAHRQVGRDHRRRAVWNDSRRPRMIRIAVSACLLGSPVRYDGRDKKSEHPILQRWMEEGRIISVCPEMLGGLGTPRLPSEIVAGTRRVVASDGRDVTGAFDAGARAALEQASGVRVAILKEGSPSCGSSYVYD